MRIFRSYKMKIRRILNNNAVVSSCKKYGDVILLGKGIGYLAKKGTAVDKSKIESCFVEVVLSHNADWLNAGTVQ